MAVAPPFPSPNETWIDDWLRAWDNWLESWGWSLPNQMRRGEGTVTDFAQQLERAAIIILREVGKDAGSFRDFKTIWKWVRLGLPLQLRLGCEQLLWDTGGEFRTLITGFRAIEGDDGQQGVFGTLPSTEKETTATTSRRFAPSGLAAPSPSRFVPTSRKLKPFWFR